VTVICWGIAPHLSEIDWYFSGWSIRKEGKVESNTDCIKELSDKDEEKQEGQDDSCAEIVEESETEEEWDGHLEEEERETRLAVVCTQAAYSFLDGSRKMTDKVSTGDHKWACIKKEVPEVSTSASNQETWTIWKAVAVSKQPVKVDPIENRAPKTPLGPKLPGRNTPALDTGNYEVLGSSYLDYTIPARQERETGELTFRLLPKPTMVSVPMDKWITARTLAAPKKITIAHISSSPGLKDHAQYTKFRYARASPPVLTKIHVHQLPMLINGGSEICVMSEIVIRALNIRWKCADWKMINADSNQSDLTKLAESVPVNVPGVVITIPIYQA